MKAVTQQIVQSIVLAVMLSAVIFVGLGAKPADAAATSTVEQMEMIQKLLIQVQDLQKMLLTMQQGMKTDSSVITPLAQEVLGTLPIITNTTEAVQLSSRRFTIVVKGDNLDQVKRVSIGNTNIGTVKNAWFTVRNNNRLTIYVPTSFAGKINDTAIVSVELYDSTDTRRSLFPVEIKKQPKVDQAVKSKPIVTNAKFSNLGEDQNTPFRMNSEFVYTVRNFNSNLVMDVEIAVDCDELVGGLERNCNYYLFDLGMKAGESYTEVKADPYVKAGSLYRFTNAGGSDEKITISGYVDPGYTLPASESAPFPSSVVYKFILRDLSGGDTDVWSKEYVVHHKG